MCFINWLSFVTGRQGILHATTKACEEQTTVSLAMRPAKIVCLLLLTACGDSTTGPPPIPPPSVATSITLSATSLSFYSLGQTQQLSASVKDQSGGTMSDATVTWATSDASVATVSSAGLVTAIADGTATITATSGSVSATATVTVQTTSSD